jgi:hypothetical protein
MQKMAIELPEEYNVPYECIVVLGRGIEKVQHKGRYVWKPTSLIEMTDKNGAHSGYRLNNSMGAMSMIGGSNANVLAAYHLFKSLSASGKPPGTIMFAAGRPQYLRKEPFWISEGEVLSKKFITKLIGKKYPGNNYPVHFSPVGDYDVADIGLVKIIVEYQNKNTFSDIKRSLEIASSSGLENIAFITIGVHLPRSAIMLSQIIENNLHLGYTFPRFLSADKILSASSPRYERIFAALHHSPEFERNAARELLGSMRFLTDDYK